MKIYITGMGCVSPIGNNIDENLESLRSCLPGLKPPVIFKSKYADKYVFGEVNQSNENLISETGLSDLRGLTRTDLLALKAFIEAVNDAKLTSRQISSRETAFVSASTVGGMCLTDQLYNDANLLSETGEFLQSYSCSAHTFKICEKFKFKGLINTVNTACSSSANAVMYGARLIKSGRVKRAIVGGVDSLSKYTVNGFNSLHILSDEKCMPFDRNRKGLNLGEAAGYMVLEPEAEALEKKCYGVLSGYGNANDAYHASSMSEEATGVTIAMKQALDSAGISAGRIDYINAHGTATVNNDFVELISFKNIFNEVPAFSSTKSYTGHTLGAAGVIESVYCILSIMNNEIYPNLTFKTPVEGFGLSPVVSVVKNADINFVMSNSYGFNGNCTSLIFGKV